MPHSKLIVMFTFLIVAQSAAIHAGLAHCRCRVTLLEHRGASIPMANVSALAEATLTIPFWYKAQQIDLALSQANAVGSCWWECRKAFGVIDGKSIVPANALKADLQNQAALRRQPFNWCGGWLSARLDYAAGTNDYRPAATELIGLGGARTCAAVKAALNSCKWTPWLNGDTPDPPGDMEMLQMFMSAGQVPKTPKFIECQTVDGVPAYDAGHAYTCQTNVGGVCIGTPSKCRDYRVRFCY